MATKQTIASVVLGLMYLPIAFFLTYLILRHIHATELMWFVWIISIPLALAINILSKLAEGKTDKETKQEEINCNDFLKMCEVIRKTGIKLRPVENEMKEVSLSEIGKDWSLYVSADGFLSAIDKEHFTGWFWVTDDKGRKFKMVNEKPLCTEICADPDLVEEETEKLTQETRNRERLRIANCFLKNEYKCKWDET